jgi:uncharacterized protein with HEPN domain
MPSSSPELALVDIANNIALAREFVRDFSYAEFAADRRTVYAVIRCLEIISEASRRLPIDLKERHPQIDWIEIAAAGSVYRHAYQLVRDDTIWETVQQSLAPLGTVAEQELNRLKSAR